MNRKSILILLIFFGAVILAGIIYRSRRDEPETERLDSLETMLEGTEISALFDDGEKLWIGTAEGILLADRDTGEVLRHLDTKLEMIYSAMIVQTPDGTVWAGHNDGLTAFDADGREICTFGAPEIPGGRVNALLATENGLWCGSQEGAAYLTPEKGEWTVEEILTTENGLAESVVQVITQVGDEIWFGSYLGEDRGGISIRGADGWNYLSTEDGIPHRYINAILALSEDRVLIGSGQLIQGGLSLAKRGPEGWYIAENWNQEDGIPGMKVRWLYLDSAGRLWITTEADGLLILDSPDALGARPLEGEVLTQASGLMDNEVKCLVECENCFFLGGKYGMTRFDKE